MDCLAHTWTCSACSRQHVGVPALPPPDWEWHGSRLLCDDCNGNPPTDASAPVANKKAFAISVTQVIRVTLDEARFDETFMEEFRDSFYPFFDLADHAKHIGQLQARGIVDLERPGPRDFVEGYGLASEMGIEATVVETEVEALSS